jgi:periplasmic divalent cation tolerance protein
MAGEHVVVFCTVPEAEKGAELGRTVVGERLAACVSIVPGLRSIYTWKGQVCDDPEALLVIKTRRERVDALVARIAALHPYEVPEIIALPIEAGHAPYLAWIDDSTR